MGLTDRDIKVLIIVLLAVLLCLPAYGPDYFSQYLSTAEANHAGFVCDHADADADPGHETQDEHRHIAHCHELDAPCVMPSALRLDYSPLVSAIASSNKGTVLDGYGAPFDIPPENRV